MDKDDEIEPLSERRQDNHEVDYDTEDYDEDHPALPRSSLTGYEETLKYIGTGRYHYFLMLTCGLANASDAVEILAISFVLPSIKSDLQLSDSASGVLTAVIFMGMMLGGWLWGTWADFRGRRRALQGALFINSLFGFLSGFASSTSVLVFLRFLSGLGVGGSIPVVWSYLCEFIPATQRGRWLSYLATAWMVGAIMCTATAWVLIPSLGWRAFVCATAIPSGVCVVSLQFCDESPKFLVVNGSVSEGEDILKRVYRTNHKTELPVDLDLGREVTVIANGGAQRSWNFKRLTNPREVYKGVISMQQKVVPMFDAVSGLLRISLILLLNWVGLSYGFYGLSLWLPQYFKNLDDMDIYRSTMIVAFAQLPGNIFSALFLDSMSRSRTLCISLVIMGVSVCTLPFLQDQSAAILASCFFNGFSVLSWNALDVATVELYPTHIRSTAFGVLSAAGRLGAICANLTFGLLMRAQPLVPLVVAGSMMVVSGVFVLGLPTTSQRTGHS